MKNFWKSRSNSHRVLILIFLTFVSQVQAQYNVDEESYFFPVRPGEENYLSGTMGEIRATHFHAGMDIKTSGISGLPVYATMDGYISRIKVSANGYGHAIYITHPNGETSVYGHLMRFRKDIGDYVREEQYVRKSFEVDLFPPREKFRIIRGDLIALSGNTGSSQGPHLHFEMRDENQHPINPLKKGFSEIRDHLPPVVRGFALKTMNINSRVDQQFGRFDYAVRHKNYDYSAMNPIEAYGEIGIQINAHDQFDGTYNHYGIPYISVYFDGKLMLEINIDAFSFNDSYHVANFFDYKARLQHKGTYQKLYIDDGNELPFYKYTHNKGIITINDEKQHEVKITFKDIAGNQSSLTIPIIGTPPASVIPEVDKDDDNKLDTEIMDNYLLVKADYQNGTPNHAFLYADRMKYEILPSYHSSVSGVYIWDLRLGLPDSIQVCGETKIFDFEVTLPSATEFNFYNNFFDIRSFRKSLYDTLFLEAVYKSLPDYQMEIFEIGDPSIPLANPIQIRFKPRLKYTPSDKFAVYSTTNMKNFSFEGNNWDGNTISVYTKNLGNFIILEDTLKPQVTPLHLSRKKISFRIRDDLSGIHKYEAYLNDQWLLMQYDPKQNYIWSEPLNPNNPMTGSFKLYVEDNVGNINEFETKIN